MSRYHHKQIELLAGQLRFSPTEKRRQQLERAERLIGKLQSGRDYPFEFICYQITEFRPDGEAAQVLFAGKTVSLDIARLAEDLSATLDLRADEIGEPLLTAEQLATEYHVSKKTVSRWRRRGLAGRYLIFADNRRRIAFLRAGVERFVSANGVRISRGMRFSRMSRCEREGIIERVRQLAAAGSRSSHQLIQQVARETGRAIETIRYTLRKHDRQHPERAIFPTAAGPLNEADRKAIYRSHLRGVSTASLAEHCGRSRSYIYRVIKEERTTAIMRRKVEFIHSEEFDAAGAEQTIIDAPHPQPEKPPRMRKAPKDLPAYLQSLYDHPLLAREQEADLFRRYNYLKSRAARLQHELKSRSATTADLDRFEADLARANAIKNRLIQCNLRLVVNIAKRHVGRNADLFELISDGNISVMKAVEKFDYSRGFKFSTYASWAIIKNYARTIPEENYRLDRFQTGREELMDLVGQTTEPQLDEDSDLAAYRKHIAAGLRHLGEREKQIVISRFGLGDGLEPKTLGQVGAVYGVTKERIRQIEARALGKLRGLLDGKKLGILP